MNTREGRSHRGSRGRFLTAMAVVTAWAATLSMGFAAEHPEHPTADSSAATVEESAEGAGLLDAKVFEGEMGKSGDQNGDKDELVFMQGKFVSTVCVPLGFSEESYVATEQDGVVSFTSKQTNDKGETMSWKGVMKGDKMAATALYLTATGETTEYWFKGTLKAGGSESTSEQSTKSEHPEHPE